MTGWETIEVRTGEFHEDTLADAEVVSFVGCEVSTWEGLADSIDLNDRFGVKLWLYECPLRGGVGYRVYEYISPLTGAGVSEGTLYPPVLDMGYGLYSLNELAEKFPQLAEGEDA